jgi:hypothetical protein
MFGFVFCLDEGGGWWMEDGDGDGDGDGGWWMRDEGDSPLVFGSRELGTETYFYVGLSLAWPDPTF